MDSKIGLYFKLKFINKKKITLGGGRPQFKLYIRKYEPFGLKFWLNHESSNLKCVVDLWSRSILSYSAVYKQ